MNKFIFVLLAFLLICLNSCLKTGTKTDEQIKRNGQLFCPEEVEYILNEEGLDGKIVLLKNKVYLFHTEFDNLAIIKKSLKKLPNYMRPSYIQQIKEWPLNHNKKICKKTLMKYIQ